MLPFLFKDFLLFPGGVESRDNICIIENHLIDRNTTCIYQAKSHLFTAKVLRDRPPPPPHHFLTESLGTHALIYLCLHSFIHSFIYASWQDGSLEEFNSLYTSQNRRLLSSCIGGFELNSSELNLTIVRLINRALNQSFLYCLSSEIVV